MATVVKLGPVDHGRPMSWEEFQAGDYENGYHYELIGGRLYVSPAANAPQGLLERWIYRKLDRYSDDRPEIINFVYNKVRVFVPGCPELTAPEPDVACYGDFPSEVPFSELQWEYVSPLLVVEVVSADDPEKDYVRNVNLYLQVPSIREYWIVDNRAEPSRPQLHIYRRQGKRWRIIDVAFGGTYTTRLLPGFRLVIDPQD
jgi:Uma2 family endonuclease